MSKTLPPLALPDDNWRSRWLQFLSGDTMHRVSSIEWMDGEMVRGNGSTVCGRDGFLMMPSIFSRMGAPRCAKCCKTLGIIGGAGAPHNVLAGESANA